MADGDLAASLGWHIPSDLDDKRDGANEIRKALDRIAAHVTSGTHKITDITGLEASLAMKAAASGVYSKSELDEHLIQDSTGSAIRSPNNATAVRTDNDGRVYSINLYNNSVTGSGSYRALYANSIGALGYVPSLRELKALTGEQTTDIAGWLGLPLHRFVYRDDDTGTPRLGWFADEVADVDPDITFTDAEGNLAGIDYAAAVVPLLAVIQSLAERITALEQEHNNGAG